MDWMGFLNQIIKIAVFPLVSILTIFLIQIIRIKIEEIKEKSNNELANKYITLLTQTISDCVIATNQTYVDALKDENVFDGEAQKEAFKRTYDAVMGILTEDAKKYLESIYGDLSEYITQRIEAEVNRNKPRLG